MTLPTALSRTPGGSAAPLTAMGLGAGFVVMWSSGFIGGRLGTQSASVLSLMSWRYLILLALGAAVLFVLARRAAGLAPRRWPAAALQGLLAQTVYLGGTVGAIGLGVGAGTSAIVAALQPLLVGALSGPLLGQRVRPRQWVGLTIGFAGVLLAVGGDLSTGSAPAWAYLLPLLGTAGLVAATLLEARDPRPPLPLVESLAVQCGAAGLGFLGLAIPAGQVMGPHLGEPAFWGAVGWVVALSTLGGYGFYWASTRLLGATPTSTLVYLTPPVTAVWAWAMFGDPITGGGLLGLLVCAAGVAVVLRPTRRDPGADQGSGASKASGSMGREVRGRPATTSR